MTGTGNDDYVWIDPDGNVVVFVNTNTPPDTSKFATGAWNDKGIVLKTGIYFKGLHIGDWNGDGKADVIGVDRITGALSVWITSYNDGAFSFVKHTHAGPWCTTGWGKGIFDIGTRYV